ncbi:hypothetical protein HY857_01185, partial [Candidatus Saccharibacteria bacterium]|nr:hypothetical protein [Candidatus Saccharibacteria bacterium]
ILDPTGFIEQRYSGRQTVTNIRKGIEQLDKHSKALLAKKMPVLILIDISDVVIDFDRRIYMAGVEGMRTVSFKRGAIYGPLPAQILINTLALVADKQRKIRAFGKRSEAVKWLLGGSK